MVIVEYDDEIRSSPQHYSSFISIPPVSDPSPITGRSRNNPVPGYPSLWHIQVRPKSKWSYDRYQRHHSQIFFPLRETTHTAVFSQTIKSFFFRSESYAYKTDALHPASSYPPEAEKLRCIAMVSSTNNSRLDARCPPVLLIFSTRKVRISSASPASLLFI